MIGIAMTSSGRYWQRILVINCLATVLVAAANGAFSSRVPLGGLIRTVAAAFVFCNCIGALCGLVLPHVSRRLCNVSFPVNWVAIAGVLLVIDAVGCLLAILILAGLGLVEVSTPEVFFTRYSESYRIGAVFTLVFGIGGTLYQITHSQLEDTAEAFRAKQREEERARQVATEARLSSLESRVRPHFLFNTLNSISALVHENPDRAERLIEHLAALLRSSLDLSEQPAIPLAEELRLVRDYLEIEKTRFGDRVRYSIDAPESLASATVPPFSVQPLVENAVKYAVSPRSAGATIRIEARRADGKLSVSVSDDGPGFAHVSLVPGHGLHTLQERLEVLFGGEATLHISRSGERTVVTVTLPLLMPVPTAV